MIYLYSGTPGSGKSMHVARDIRDALQVKKRPVVCNFDVNSKLRNYGSLFRFVPNSDLSPDLLYEHSRRYFAGKPVIEDAILLVIDEAQLVFNSRTWQDRGASSRRMDWIEFFSQHRHYGYKIVLVSQYDRMLDRQIRSLIEIEVNHRKLANFGLKGFLLSLPFAGKLFLAVSYYYGMREKVGSSFLLPRRAYFRVYDSYNRFRQVPGTA
ncbi:zonular occludens toxin domain-containing protein [Adlercreutzia caecimuris]|uniref:Zona occludens toxin N-terminal domain-containing protein n=1 Tax=Adlercreutzia caecimuris TaxID=671266 RepID=A0A4V3WV52_9ACTN|nr:zonular occludens toxin domain-containing protein [Adlercreutzia caecimuris]THG38317.1 hypothetical protein E5986_02545 [Adlercreutzia caecimuris]